MAKKGMSQHLKSLTAPTFWPILRKEYVWVIKPNPGPHPLNRCIPLLILIRDVLKIAENAREAKRVIFDGNVYVDGIVRRDYKFPVGLMDIVKISKADKSIRIVPYPVKYLWYVNIPEEEARLKLVRIENKTLVKDGNIQLNLHDGRNIVIKRFQSEPINYKTYDTLLIEIPSQTIIKHIPLEVNKLAIVIDGRNVGRIGKIININERTGMKRKHALITLEDLSGHRFQTILDYVMVIGEEKPLIKLYEG
ncbi:MAG: 30S ribosomal protein S4e [Ignisphaera sp.]|uniref:Small ribosomal subunit protein eS4 n=1 Tax=Ignisphaera aggregans TaxID=334771 RepID=A0A7J3MZD2_9CREN